MHRTFDTSNDAGHLRLIVVAPHELLHVPHEDTCMTVCRVEWTGSTQNGRVVDERIICTSPTGQRVEHDPEAHHTPSWLAAHTPTWTTTSIPPTRRAAG